MEQLINFLKEEISEASKSHPEINLSKEALEKLHSVYPFNKFEYVIVHLISLGILSIEEYSKLRINYLERNKYLFLYEITAPRTFGETWAQKHLNKLVPQLKKPHRDLDPSYSGQYDFWLEGIRVEVKASRAVRRQSGRSLVEKALSSQSKEGFDMNFQQIKPDCCDAFVLIGVWKDLIRYWVMSSDEVKVRFSPHQHRLSIGEGQLWMTESNINDFSNFESDSIQLLAKIREKGS